MTITVFKNWRGLLWVCVAATGCTTGATAGDDSHLVGTPDAGDVADAAPPVEDAASPIVDASVHEPKTDSGVAVVVDSGVEVDAGGEPDASVARPSGGFCGDGVWNASEQCDDGNVDSNDGCDADCTIPCCGDGLISPSEQCDDANAIEDDGCTSECHYS